MVEEDEDGRVVQTLQLPFVALEDAQHVAGDFGGARLRIRNAMEMARKAGSSRE